MFRIKDIPYLPSGFRPHHRAPADTELLHELELALYLVARTGPTDGDALGDLLGDVLVKRHDSRPSIAVLA